MIPATARSTSPRPPQTPSRSFVLCYNQPLAVKLDAVTCAKGLAAKVHVRNFHKWVGSNWWPYGQALPAQGPDMFEQMVAGGHSRVDRGQIPSGQYQPS